MGSPKPRPLRPPLEALRTTAEAEVEGAAVEVICHALETDRTSISLVSVAFSMEYWFC